MYPSALDIISYSSIQDAYPNFYKTTPPSTPPLPLSPHHHHHQIYLIIIFSILHHPRRRRWSKIKSVHPPHLLIISFHHRIIRLLDYEYGNTSYSILRIYIFLLFSSFGHIFYFEDSSSFVHVFPILMLCLYIFNSAV